MENFILSFNIIFPIFMIMAIGYILRQVGILSDTSVNEMNKAVFKVFLPLLLFNNVYTSDVSGTFRPFLMIYAAGAVLLQFVLSLIIALISEKDNKKRGVMVQGMFRSNFVIFGLPVTQALFGSDAAAMASLLIAVVVPTYNVLAVIDLTVFGGAEFNLKKILKGIVTNPLIIASVLGLVFLGFKIPIATPIHTIISDLAKIATPLAFVLLGASFKFSEVRQYVRHLVISLSAKLVIFPLIVLTPAIIMGFSAPELAILLSMSASPVAVSSFTMAQQMGGDDKLAGQLVVFSSVFCILTMFLWIFSLKQFGWM